MAKGKKDDARSAAARVITLVLEEGRSLAAALPPALATLPPAERGLAQELCYGTLRWAPRLEALADKLLDKPLRARDRDVHALLLTGLYQLLYLNVPVHAAVSLTVDATARLGKDWARGLLNGVLRRLQREQEALLAAVDAGDTAALAHPAWLLGRLAQDWPEHWRDIAAANNVRPPMTLRVNRLHGSREQYLERLQQAGLPAAASSHAPDALTLETPVAVERLPGFADGDVSVQDAAAQLAAGLLQLAPGQRVLDACAAPGGKTGHILEACPDVELLALDSDAERLARVQENLTRLGLTAELRAGDAGDPKTWWDGRPYDRILLDAPCSGSGVIRRHPDIKSLRRAEDIAALNLQQARLLRALWPLLAPGGILVYATCSILTAENAGQVTAFLRDEAQARELPISAAWGLAAAAGRQILPGENGMDGFYYAALGKA
jgi:16S rRNA (cytosine967-C5)-methyltransferase